MEGSLDDLVHCLLDDIALCGEQGASTGEVLRFLAEHASRFSSWEEDDRAAWKVDRAFQGQVWQWLTRHPDIKVGKDGKAKQWSLATVQAHNGKITSKTKERNDTTLQNASIASAKDKSFDAYEATPASLSTDHILLSKDGNKPPAQTDQTVNKSSLAKAPKSPLFSSTPARAQATLREPSNDATFKRQEPHIKLYACDDRLWWAAAGHGPDHEKVPPNHFSCLSIIASFREKGIPQPELVRLSGQDNRSVPKRTQTLQEQGYIEKVPTFFKGHRTSQCILRRFAGSFSMEKNLETIVETSQRRVTEPDDSKSSKSSKSTYLGMIQYRDRIEKMFELLQQNPIYGWNKLKKDVCVLDIWFQSRVLAVSVRRWESYGVVKRVRAIASYDPEDGEPCQCVELLRLPDEKDWLLFYKFEPLSKLHYPLAEGGGSDDDDGDEAENLAKMNDSEQDDLARFQTPPPFWRPHQPFGQFLYDAISSGGTNGMSTMALKDFALGSFFERPLEHTLTRLEDSWQMSQPLHLRHLAVIRDVATVSRVPHYVHFTFPNYKIKVERGDVEWEAVESVKPGKAEGNERVTAVAELDDYGFPILDKNKFSGKQRCATLAQCVEADKRTLFSLKGQDPMVISHPDGTLDVSWENNPYPKVRRSHAAKTNFIKVVDANGEPVPYVERRGGRRIPKPKSDLHYFPSRFAHTRIVIVRHSPSKNVTLVQSKALPLVPTFVSSSGVSGWHDQNKPGPPKPKGRPPKVSKQQVKRAKPSLATVISGTELGDLHQKGSGATLRSGKRDATAAELENVGDKSKRRRKDIASETKYLPSTYAHTASILHPYLKSGLATAGRLKPMLTRKFTVRKPRPDSQSTKEPKLLSYEEQAKAIKCEQIGIYVGESAKLRRIGGRGRAPNSRLAIFKSSRFGQFPWFLQDAPFQKARRSTNSSCVPKDKLPWINEESHQRIPQQPSNLDPSSPSQNANQRASTRRTQQGPSFFQPSTPLPDSPAKLPGETSLVAQERHASPYNSHHTVCSPTFTPVNQYQSYGLNHTPVMSDYSGMETTPMIQQSPYAPTSSYPTYLAPYAPTTAPHTIQGSDDVLSPLPTISSSQYPQLQGLGIMPNNQATPLSPILQVSSKRPYVLGVDEAPVQNIGSRVMVSTMPPSKRRKVGHGTQGVTAKRQCQKPSSLRLVLRGLNPTRYQNVLQALEEPHSAEPITNYLDETASLAEGSLGNLPSPSLLKGAEEAHGLALGVQHTGNALQYHAQKPPVEHGSIKDKVQASNCTREEIPINPEDTARAEEFTKEKTQSQSVVSSSLTQLQSPTLDDENDYMPPRNHLDPQRHPLLENAIQPEFDAQSVSSGQSFATAHSRTHQSCSDDDQADCDRAKTSDIPLDIVNEENLDTRAPLRQVIPLTNCTNLIGRDSIVRQDALIESIPFSHHDLSEPLATTPRKEPTITNLNHGPADQRKGLDHTDLAITPLGSNTNNMESEPTGDKSGQVQGAEEETIVKPVMDLAIHQDHEENGWSDFEVMDTNEGMPQTPRSRPRRTPRPFSNQQVISSGGSIGVLRRKIIMGILEEAGGLYPSGTELWFPFMAAWLTKGIASKPDNRTIRFAAKALIDSGKARQLIFTFKTKKGVAVQKKILMLSNMASTDPKVLELKRQMIDKHPQCHFPPKPELPSALKRGLDGQGLLEQLAGEEIFPTIQELDQKKAEEKAIKEQMDREKKERKAAWQLEAAQRCRAYVPENNAEKRLEKPKDSEVSVLPQPLNHLLRWQMLPPGTWHNPQSARSEFDADYEAKLARLRLTMSDAERYKMLDSMSPYDSIRMGSENSKRPRKPMQSRKKKAIQAIEEPVDKHLDQNIMPDLTNQDRVCQREENDSVTLVRVEKPKKVVIETLPRDLDGMLSQYSPPSLPLVNDDVSDHARFNNIVDRVVYWELDTELAPTADTNTLYFINLECPELYDLAVPPKQGLYNFFNVFKDQENVMADLARMRVPKALKVDFHISKLPEPYAPEKIIPRKLKVPKEPKVPKQRRQIQKKSRSSAQSKVVERLTLLKERVSQLEPIEIDPKIARSYGNLRLRGPASLRYLPEAEERRVVLAVIIVRTLTGGLEKNIDWQLVTKIFKQQYTEVFLHRKWAYMLQKYRSHLNKLQDNFQRMFAEAYEDELVPPIDFDHLDQYEWDTVLAWTDKRLDALYSSPQLAEDGEDLPLQRSDLDDIFDLQAPAEYDTITEYYELQGPATIPRRYVVAHSEPAVKLLTPRKGQQNDGIDADIQHATNEIIIAKSWVKANIITPVSTYSSEFASSKFSLLPDSAIQNALKALFNSKQITQETKTMYELASAFVFRLNRNIGVGMLKDAAATKMQLDDAFQHGGTASIQQTASDGHCLTIINLAMHGKVTMRAKNPPVTKWGLVEKGQYETRRMDKKKMLYFDVEVYQKAEYESGCPLPLPLPEPPLQPEQRTIEKVMRVRVPAAQVDSESAVGPLAAQEGSISQSPSAVGNTKLRVTYAKATRKEPTPLWFDINGSLVPELWETCLSAVLSTIILRPSIPLRTLCLGFRDTLEEFEIEALVQWLVDAKAVQWSTEGETGRNRGGDGSKGVEPKEGWWGVFWQRVEKEQSGHL